MNHARPPRARYLLIVRLNNFSSIEGAYGERAAAAALDHLRRAAGRHLPGVAACQVERNEVELLLAYYPLRSLPVTGQVDELCAALTAHPFHFEGEDILLSLSAGYGMPGVEPACMDRLRQEARATLAASIIPQDTPARPAAAGSALYREDMAMAASLVDAARRGATRLAWRPVADSGRRAGMLHHEVLLRQVGRRGEPVDSAQSHAALGRLGLAHILDRMMLSAVLDELESDPFASLSVPLSARSLSAHLHGRDLGWSDLLARLRRDPDLARRLVVEIVEDGRIASLSDAQAFIALLRKLGTRIALAGFGSGHASIGELLLLSPDMVKLDGAFLRASAQSMAHRQRLRHLVALARTVSPVVILDGADTPHQADLAREEGADGLAGSWIGRPATVRFGQGDDLARFTAFNSRRLDSVVSGLAWAAE